MGTRGEVMEYEAHFDKEELSCPECGAPPVFSCDDDKVYAGCKDHGIFSRAWRDMMHKFSVLCQKCGSSNIMFAIGEVGVVFIHCRKCGIMGSMKADVVPTTKETRKDYRKQGKPLVRVKKKGYLHWLFK